MSKFTGVSVVFAAQDENVSLRKCVDIFIEKCPNEYIYEIIFVINKNKVTPGCLSAIEYCTEKYKNIKITVLHQTHAGLSGAAYDAFMIAEGSHILGMPTDLDTDPAVAAKLCCMAKEYPDDVNMGSRLAEGGGFEGYGKFKEFLNRTFNTLVRWLFHAQITDFSYSFRVISREMLDVVPLDYTKNYIFIDSTLKLLKLGYTFHEIPTKWTVRQEGHSHNPFFKRNLPAIIDVIKVKFFYHPKKRGK